MTAVNVNLGACNCGGRQTFHSTTHESSIQHMDSCAAYPARIPCPIQRSVTMAVRLGECECHVRERPDVEAGCCRHAPDCPSTPIRVACSIGGETWEESEVVEVDWQTRNERGDWDPSPMSHAEMDAAVAACRDRWALVKALLSGMDLVDWSVTGNTQQIIDLWNERDAVFAALADMARAEQEAFQRQEAAVKALGEPTFLPDNFHRAEPHARPSASVLARYVEHLIEQVGAL